MALPYNIIYRKIFLFLTVSLHIIWKKNADLTVSVYVFMSHTRQTDTCLIAEKERDKVVPSPLTKIQNPSFVIRPTIRRCFVSILKAWLKNPQELEWKEKKSHFERDTVYRLMKHDLDWMGSGQYMVPYLDLIFSVENISYIQIYFSNNSYENVRKFLKL
jgi:hypothetical protein